MGNAANRMIVIGLSTRTTGALEIRHCEGLRSLGPAGSRWTHIVARSAIAFLMKVLETCNVAMGG
jgi:hypothetical protein